MESDTQKESYCLVSLSISAAPSPSLPHSRSTGPAAQNLRGPHQPERNAHLAHSHRRPSGGRSERRQHLPKASHGSGPTEEEKFHPFFPLLPASEHPLPPQTHELQFGLTHLSARLFPCSNRPLGPFGPRDPHTTTASVDFHFFQRRGRRRPCGAEKKEIKKKKNYQQWQQQIW